MNTPHVHRFLAQESDSTPEVERHLAQCSKCRSLADALTARQSDLDRALNAFDTAVPFEDAFARAKEAASLTKIHHRWWETKFNGVILTLAASLTFAVVFGNLFSGHTEPADFVSMEDVDGLVDELADLTVDDTLSMPIVRWQRTADDLLDMVYDYDHESIRTDPVSKRRLFRLLTTLANAADNGNFTNPRIYRERDGQLMNVGYRWAGCMAAMDRDLLNREWPYEEMKRQLDSLSGRVANGEITCDIDEDGVLTLPEDMDLTPAWNTVAQQIREVSELEEGELDAEAWGEVALEIDGLAKSIERFASNGRQDALVIDAFAQVARVAYWGTYPAEYRGWPVVESRDGSRTYDLPMRDLQSRMLAHPEFVKRLPTEDLRVRVQAYIDLNTVP